MYLQPSFKGPLEGYVVNYIARNGWKVERTQTRDDLLQDAYVVYLRVERRYQDLDTPQHFMALFKTAWQRHFTDLANADTRSRVLVPLVTRDEAGEETEDRELAGDSDNDGYLAIMLRQAPGEVKTVLNLFLSAPQEILDLVMAAWPNPDRRARMRDNERLNRMLGLPKGADAMQAVHDYFH